MNYMEWALEKAKKLWREREQVMKERLSRAVAAGSGICGELLADAAGGDNAGFDMARFIRMKEGQRA